jgi:hypothetical protein
MCKPKLGLGLSGFPGSKGLCRLFLSFNIKSPPTPLYERGGPFSLYQRGKGGISCFVANHRAMMVRGGKKSERRVPFTTECVSYDSEQRLS